MGGETLQVSRELHRLNRQRLAEELRKSKDVKSSIVVLQGGESQTLYCSDKEITFRQVDIIVILYTKLCTYNIYRIM